MTPPSIEWVLRSVAALVALVITMTLPAVTYLNGRRADIAVIETQSRVIAEGVSDFVSDSPLQWEYQMDRLGNLLRQHHAQGHTVELFGPTDTLIAAVPEHLAPPTFVARHPVYDYGQPVGSIAVSSSQRPLLIQTGWAGLLGLLIASIIYFPLRNVPLRALHRSQEELRRLNEALEQRVVERTAKLAAANRELETFAYTVAHDLKTPLRGIDGYSHLLLEDYGDKFDAEARRYLGNVRAATSKMSQLIDDLLAWSRLERDSVRAAPVDVQALIEPLVAECADEAKARGVAVSVAIPFASLNADRNGLAMALRNLLGNAIKFTRDTARPAIEIGGRDGVGSCVLWVRDNGAGFDMQYRERIFEIFQRLHRDEDYPGSGVGLAIVRKVIERMGGRAWAESAPGEGATFYLEMPK